MDSATLAARRQETRRRRSVRTLLRFAGPLLYAAALATAIAVRGLPTSRDALFLWILLGLLAFTLTDPRRWLKGVLADWLPFGAILFTYDLLRGSADEVFSAYYLPQLRADELMFGGAVPTVWLQERLWDGAGGIDWIDYATWVVYLTHFFGTLVVAASLWLFARGYFRRYIAMVCALAAAGFVTYLLFPAAPPWLASEQGHLAPTDRIVRFVSEDVPIGFFGAIWESGARYANDVAAVPSLHAAYAALISLFLWRIASWRWRVPLALYPLAMGFALVYTAEHYVSDILLGWLYAAGAVVLVDALARRWRVAG